MAKKKSENYILNFRNAIKEFAMHKMAYRIDRGDYDKAFKAFLNANVEDNFGLDFRISFLSNDILLMRVLAGETLNDEILSKLKKLWDKET